MKYFFATLLIVCLASCKKERTLTHVTLNNVGDTAIDTLLTLDSLNFIDPKGDSKLTEAMAKQALDNYYSAKGIHDFGTDYQDEEGNQVCAYYDTLYTYNLNDDKHEDGIIEYHLMPCSASGHCYQPTYAIITNIKGKYKLISAEILPEGFGLDTIISDKEYNLFYYYKFDCSQNKITSRYKSKIPR